ncbi:MAG: flagellar hook protein FlgE [Pseudomonadota bacterium]|nr:flagellar hook protein FlgE [Pseudomonadota bacterium]
MGFQQGLSGLNAASKNLDVISNNIANVGTVGFKSSRAEFADVYATATFGAGDLQSGLGAQTVSVAQQFTQGGLSVTNNPLDVAISGSGFFRLSGEGGTTYTRSGQFRLDKEGFLVTNTGENVTGYTQLTLDSAFNVVGTTSLGNVQIDLDGINAQATSDLSLNLNLDAAAVAPTVAFSPTTSTSYNYSTSVTVFDSLGSEHSIQYYFRKEVAPDNTWSAYAYMDGTATGLWPVGDQLDLNLLNTSTLPAGGAHTMTFSSAGNLITGTSATNASVTPPGAAPLIIAMDFTGSSQYSGGSGINSVSQNGFQSGNLVGLSIGDDGVIAGRYSNGVTQPLQQLVLVTFRNPQSMIPVGQNQWVSTIDAGAETINNPGEGVAGLVQAGSVEDSNTDLTGELVNLIVAQRLYQANAQTISAQSTILQTLVNLR